MTESKSQPKRSLIKAEAVLRAQWPEVLQYLGDRSNLNPSHDLLVAHSSLSLAIDCVAGKALAVPSPDPSTT
jgi:hypothetical protein